MTVVLQSVALANGREMDMVGGRSCKIPAWSGTGPVAQPVFKADSSRIRSDPPEHALTRLAGVSPARLERPNTLGHAGTGCSCGQEMDRGR